MKGRKTTCAGLLMWVGFCALIMATGCVEEAQAPTLSGYPSGPYGGQVGDTIENLTLFDLEGEPLSLDAFHNTEAPVLVLYITATWCFTCGPEIDWLNAQVEAGGLPILPVTVVVEDENYNPAGAQAGQVFEHTYKPDFQTLTDPEQVLSPYRDANAIPLNLVIRTDTMTITHRAQGFDEASLRQAIEEATP